MWISPFTGLISAVLSIFLRKFTEIAQNRGFASVKFIRIHPYGAAPHILVENPAENTFFSTENRRSIPLNIFTE